MKTKLLRFSDKEVDWIQTEANKKELTFSHMVRRIIDERYEKTETETEESEVKNA